MKLGADAMLTFIGDPMTNEILRTMGLRPSRGVRSISAAAKSVESVRRSSPTNRPRLSQTPLPTFQSPVPCSSTLLGLIQWARKRLGVVPQVLELGLGKSKKRSILGGHL